MKINSKTTIKDLELNSGISQIEYLLEESSSYGPGFLIALIHFILSKLRTKKESSILIDSSNFEHSYIERKFYDFYQLVVVLLFENSARVSFKANLDVDQLRESYKKDILLQEYLYSSEMYSTVDKKFETNILKDLRNSLFASKSRSKLTKGFSLLIPCFSHLKEIDRSRYLYSGNSIKSTQDIEQWIKRLFKYHKLNLDPSGLHKSTYSHISEIVKELFHNTQEWARTTFDDSRVYHPGFSGVFLSLYLESRLKYNWGSIDEISEYVKKVLSTEHADLQIHYNQQSSFLKRPYKVSIFEISVIDTGPGLARRWLEKDYHDITKEEEISAVKKCFHKYITSDSSGLMNLRGQGLSKVLSLIGRIGLIRIHSGGVLLSRNFLEKKLHADEIVTSSIHFNSKSVNRIEGTCITILYPIIYTE